MRPGLEGVAKTLEDFIAARQEDIDHAEAMLRVLRYGPAPEQPELFDADPAALRLVSETG